MINDLSEIISINSEQSASTPDAPFGVGTATALNWFLAKARSYGLNVGNDDNYCGWAEYGEGETLVGVLGHLDVVPAGNGWSNDPYKLTIENGKLYGRGVSDDKGPIVACLHALKSLAEQNIKLNGRVRLIVGLNEESGSECVKHYKKSQEIPTVSFTPDSDFPVIASEKGILHIKVACPMPEFFSANITMLGGGTRANIVPDHATFTIKKSSELFAQIAKKYESRPFDMLLSENTAFCLAQDGCDVEDFSVQMTDDGIKIEAKGTAAHASTPEHGDNAIRKIFSLLTALSGDKNIAWINDHLSSVYAKDRLGINAKDNSGELTYNLGVCTADDKEILLTIDIRRPVCFTEADVINAIKSKMPKQIKIDIIESMPPLYIPEDSELVQTLLKVYQEASGDYISKPLHIGGGTYAKELPNCIAFGAVFPNVETHMHEADECYPIEQYQKLPEIYKKAIIALDKMINK